MVQVLFNQPTNRGQVSFCSRIVRRAETLNADGYEIITLDATAKTFRVYRPETDPFGDNGYTVCNRPGEENCSCECFRSAHDCKHRIGVALQEETADKIYRDMVKMRKFLGRESDDILSFTHWYNGQEAAAQEGFYWSLYCEENEPNEEF